jgi:hypothetical protein
MQSTRRRSQYCQGCNDEYYALAKRQEYTQCRSATQTELLNGSFREIDIPGSLGVFVCNIEHQQCATL